MGNRIETPVKLTHGDGLRIDDAERDRELLQRRLLIVGHIAQRLGQNLG